MTTDTPINSILSPPLTPKSHSITNDKTNIPVSKSTYSPITPRKSPILATATVALKNSVLHSKQVSTENAEVTQVSGGAMPQPKLATDFEEWLAGCAYSMGGTRYKKRVQDETILPGHAWKSFPKVPSPTLVLKTPARSTRHTSQSTFSPATSSSSFETWDSRRSSASSVYSQYAAPPAKSDPLFVTELFNVLHSAKGGYGAFATKDINIGTIIHSESPLFRASVGEVPHQYEQLTEEQRQEYLALYDWSLLGSWRLISIFKTNRFELPGSRCGIFIIASRFNHACHPHATCTYRWDQVTEKMVFTSINKITEGEELTIQYCASTSKLWQDYGFYCDCPSCPDPKVAAVEALNQNQYVSGIQSSLW